MTETSAVDPEPPPLDPEPLPLEVDAGFVVATGIECSAPVIDGDRRMDELAKTGHYERWEDDLRLVRETGIRYLRYGIPIHVVNPAPGVFDWSFPDRALGRCRELGVVIIADLLHFGVPDDVDGFEDPALLPRFEAFARAIAERYPSIRHYTPVNEPLITAMWSARLGYWNERRHDEASFVRALLNVCRCAVLATRAIRSIRPDAVFIQSETCHYHHAESREDEARAALENELRFSPFELVYGRPLPGLVADHLLANGASREELSWFDRHGSSEGGIAGNDYYVGSEQLVSPDGAMLSSGVRLGYYELAKQYHERLGVPIMHTETNREASQAVEWLQSQWADVERLRAAGVPIRGFTWYGFVNHVDWDSALRRDHGIENDCGLVDLERRPNPVYPHFKALAESVAAESAGASAARSDRPARSTSAPSG